MLYSGSLSNKISKREEENYELSLQMALEGMVLLKNDAVLPLKTKEIALYGLAARHTCFGGTGSGEVRSRFKISIYEGLKNEGFNILTEDYLTSLDNLVKEEKEAWVNDLKVGIKKEKLLNILDYAGSHPFTLNKTIPITDKKETNVCLYCLRREAGEGADRKYENGDVLLSDFEKEEIKKLTKMYEDVILVLNTPGVVEDITNLNVKAIIYTGLSGMMLGRALALLLAGKVNFSGHLAETWAKRKDYPISYVNDSLDDNYNDSIYVGYRYFTSFNKEVIYPFGYGLTYTNFKIKFKDIDIKDTKISLTFNILNKGLVKGKEVVMLYLSFPGEQREKYALVGFNKTPLLASKENVNLTITFDILDFTHFKDGKYLLDKGLYLLSYGNNVEALEELCYLKLKDEIVVKEVKSSSSFNNLDEISTSTLAKINKKLKVYNLDFDVLTYKPIYEDMIPELNSKAYYIYDKLSIKDKIHLLVGSSYLGRPYYKTFGAAGSTTSKFHKLGLNNLVMADGPQGLNLAKESLKPIFKFVNFPVLPEALYYTSIGKLLTLRKIKVGSKQKIYFQFTTSFPSASVMAQTWSTSLLEEEGKALKREMEEYNVNYLLAPGVNIKRDPLGGRNYEYYSEDPYLSAILAISLAKGVEGKKTHVTLKHYSCNNRENNRNKISSNLSERTFREIYLRPFELAITKTNIGAVMSSYNKVNHEYVTNSYHLLTTILRHELNFKGIVMTDWFNTGHDESSNVLAIKAGTNFIMPGLPNIRKELYKAYKKGLIQEDTINKLVKIILANVI